MADLKISALPASTVALAGTEVLPIVQSSTTKQVSVANLTAGRAVSAASLALTTSPLPVDSGGTGLTTLIAGYIPYGNATSAFSNSANLYYGGKNMGLGTSSPVDFGSGYTTLSISDTTGGAVAFLAAGTQKASIFNGGNAMYIDCNNAAGVINFRNTATGATMQFGSAGIVTMLAYGAGAATFSAAGVISSVSDETWKIKDGVPTDPDAMLKKLEPGYWYYNKEKKEIFGSDRQLGFYAQNVNSAIGPEAAPTPETITTKNQDGSETTVTKPWGYYDRSVLAITVMSLQKALDAIDFLTARIAVLETK